MRTLVMLSGGVDSTYALVRLLRDTDDEVVAHHIACIDDSGRHLGEGRATHQIVDYCKKRFRDFVFSLNNVDHRGFKAEVSDALLAAYEAGVISASYHLANNKEIRLDRWLVGHCREKPWIGEQAHEARTLCHLNCQRLPEPAFFLMDPIAQADQIADMPAELVEMTWSCRQPDTQGDRPVPCGKCPGCERRRARLDKGQRRNEPNTIA